MAITPRMWRLHAALTDEPTLAYDLAQAAEVDNQSAGSALNALKHHGMAAQQWDAKHKRYLWYRAELPGP